jgi:hypothetical protein
MMKSKRFETTAFLAAIGVILLLSSLFQSRPADADLAEQVTITPTVFSYLPFVAKNWSPPITPTPTHTPTATPTPTSEPTDTPTPTSTPSDNELQNGVPVTGLSGSMGDKMHFYMNVPSGASNLVFEMSGGSGDADLYVNFGSQPTTSDYDCRPYTTGNDETCTFGSPEVGTYYVMLRAYDDYSGVTLVGSYDVDITPMPTETGEPTNTPTPTPTLTSGGPRPGHWEGQGTFTGSFRVESDRTRITNFEGSFWTPICGYLDVPGDLTPPAEIEISDNKFHLFMNVPDTFTLLRIDGTFNNETSVEGDYSWGVEGCAVGGPIDWSASWQGD